VAMFASGTGLNWREIQHMYRRNQIRDPIDRYTPRAWITLVGVSALMMSASGVAQATKLTNSGTAVLDAGNGSVVVSGNGTTSGCMNWYNSGSAPTTCPSASTGTLTVEAGSTSPFINESTGTIQNLEFNTPFPLVDFISISEPGPLTLDFDLLDIRFNGSTAIGDCTTTNGSDGLNDTSPGATCTPPHSPFTLTNGLADPNNNNMVDTVSIGLTFDAEGYTGSSGTNYNQADPYIGIVTTAQAVQGMNIQTVLNTIATGGSVHASWQGTLTPISEIPEPESFLLLGAGLTAIGLFKRNAPKS